MSGTYLIPRRTLLGAENKTEQQNFEIKAMRVSFYTKFCNHWVALVGVGRTSAAAPFLLLFFFR